MDVDGLEELSESSHSIEALVYLVGDNNQSILLNKYAFQLVLEAVELPAVVESHGSAKNSICQEG